MFHGHVRMYRSHHNVRNGCQFHADCQNMWAVAQTLSISIDTAQFLIQDIRKCFQPVFECSLCHAHVDLMRAMCTELCSQRLQKIF